MLSDLGILEPATTYRAYIGGTLIVTGGLLIAQASGAVLALLKRGFGKRMKRIRRAEALEAEKEALQGLTGDERTYLAPFVLGGENTVYFHVQDGVAGGLEAKEIIYRASTVGDMINGFAFNLQPWARQYLEEHPEILKGLDPHLPPARDRFRW